MLATLGNWELCNLFFIATEATELQNVSAVVSRWMCVREVGRLLYSGCEEIHARVSRASRVAGKEIVHEPMQVQFTGGVPSKFQQLEQPMGDIVISDNSIVGGILDVAMKQGGTKQLVHEPNIPVSNNNSDSAVGDVSNVSLDNRNLDVGSDSKRYEPKMPPALTIPPVLNIDSQNYMLHVSNSSETRPRSFSFTNGATKTNTISNSRQLMEHHYHANKSPVDLDMFCVRETVNSIAAAVLACAPRVQQPSTSPSLAPNMGFDTQGCARPLSFHNLMCSCNITCCCMCATLCSPDCHACFHSLRDKHTFQKSDVVPQLAGNKKKVSTAS